MKSKTARAVAAAVGLLVGIVSVKPAAAQQWGATAIGVAEYDTEQTLLLLAGVSTGPRGMGLRPRIGVQGYNLSYDGGTDNVNVIVVKPYVGLANTFEGGSVYGNVGYAFSNKDEVFTSGAFVPDRGDGVVLSGGWDQWGTGGPLGYQVLGAYNLGTESFWGRGRVTTRLGQATTGQRRIGGEVAFLSGEGYSGVQPGAILELHNGRGRILGLGAGMKFIEGEDAVYFKAEMVLPIAR